jgi:hypothetical protein
MLRRPRHDPRHGPRYGPIYCPNKAPHIAQAWQLCWRLCSALGTMGGALSGGSRAVGGYVWILSGRGLGGPLHFEGEIVERNRLTILLRRAKSNRQPFEAIPSMLHSGARQSWPLETAPGLPRGRFSQQGSCMLCLCTYTGFKSTTSKREHRTSLGNP